MWSGRIKEVQTTNSNYKAMKYIRDGWTLIGAYQDTNNGTTYILGNPLRNLPKPIQ